MRNINWIEFYLLNVDKKLVGSLKQVTSTDNYLGMSKNFHPQGLYSNEIFGPVGSDERDNTFAYIDVKTEIISPALAIALFELKKLYSEICSGKRYAVWDDKEKDFEPALPSDKGAGTGYSFFISKYKELNPKENTSLKRNETIEFFNTHRDIALSRYVLVHPAGLRDIMVEGETDKEDEVNPLYRKLLSLARTIPERASPSPLTDAARWKLQEKFIEIWKHFFNFLDGKKGYSRGKATSRKVMNGTRNVISSFATGSVDMLRDDALKPTDTQVGIYQGLKALLPVAQYHIRERYLSQARAGDGQMYGVNKKTLKRELARVSPEVFDLYNTDDGVEKLINRLAYPEERHKNLSVGYDHWLALVYRDEEYYKVFFDIDELPEGFSKDNVYPITLCELLYLSGVDVWNNYFGYVTRYPITGQGSIYSSTIRLETTVRTRYLKELGEDWDKANIVRTAASYPRRDVDEFVTSLAPHPSRINGLGADFDGDTCSFNAVMSDEALGDTTNYIGSRNYWFSTSGKFKPRLMDDVVERALDVLLEE